MDKKTELLISLGASTAANCMPCFSYYYLHAQKLGLEQADILQAVEIGNKIKNSIGMLTGNHIRKTMGMKEQDIFAALEDTELPCCEKP